MKFFGSLVEGNGWVGKYYKLDKQIFDLLSLQSIDLKKYPYLLESSSRGNKKNRFSILFFKPKILLQKTKDDKKNFLDEFDIIWRKEKVEQKGFFSKIKIPFCGGWFVYLGYRNLLRKLKLVKYPRISFKLPTAFASRVNTQLYLIMLIMNFNYL